jgi:hypothetical protein
MADRHGERLMEAEKPLIVAIVALGLAAGAALVQEANHWIKGALK